MMEEESAEGPKRPKQKFPMEEGRVADPISDSDLEPPLTSNEGDLKDEELKDSRRERGKRRRHIEELAKEFGMDDDEKIRLLELVQDLLPETSRMSRADDIRKRLSHGFEETRSRHPKLLFTKRTRYPIDITDTKRVTAGNKELSSIFDNEEEILRALIINDRVLAGLSRWVTEHEETRSMLLTEMVRRSTLVEQWRHMLPKFMLPLSSMLFEAKAGWKDLRVNAKLFNRIRDAIIEWSGDTLSRDDLMLAARRTEEEFMSILKEKDFSGEADDMEEYRGRLRLAYEDARKILDEQLSLAGEGTLSSPELDAIKLRVRRLEVVTAMKAGLDREGRLVFSSLEDFDERSTMVAPSRRHAKQDDLPQAATVMHKDGSPQGVLSEGSVSDAGSEEGEYDELPLVEVRGDGMIFVPEMLDSVPTSYPDTLALAGTLPRSTGLSRSLSDKPFFKYGPNALKPPFTFVAFRRHPDLSSREGIEGTIEPVDLSRIELGDGDWVVSQMPGFSPVLGANHPLMLPPHSSLAWYGRKLGWSETEIRGLSAFGSPARPETITTKGGVEKLVNAMRGVARLRVDELAQKVPGHHLAKKDGQELRDEAVEDLARWWIFILLARHRQADFELLLPKFFHNVQAPDFALMEDGTMNFGSGSNASRSIIFSIKLKNIVSSNDEEASAKMLGIGGKYSGARRLGVL